jgi:hypothetical protein
MLHTRWSAEAWAQVRVEFTKALALRSLRSDAPGGSISPLNAPAVSRGDRVWVACSCGAVLVRIVAFG